MLFQRHEERVIRKPRFLSDESGKRLPVSGNASPGCLSEQSDPVLVKLSVIDLDYNVPELWDYQIESLKGWARIVDGFRCDVASFIPVEFWKRARREIAEIKPDFIWLAESVHRGFSVECRRRGMYSATDTEAFEAFDIEYEYDVREAFDKYVDGKGSLSL